MKVAKGYYTAAYFFYSPNLVWFAIAVSGQTMHLNDSFIIGTSGGIANVAFQCCCFHLFAMTHYNTLTAIDV